MIESSLLHVLSEVEKTGSFSKAALNLGVTQSAISQKVKTLESKIGQTLFKRKGKTFELTKNAKKLTKISRHYQKKLDEFFIEMRLNQTEVAGSLRVGTLYGVGKSWLSSQMIEFAKDYKELKISLSLEFHDNLLRDFENDEYHALILPEYLTPPKANAIYLHDEYSVLIYPSNGSITIAEELTFKEFCQLPFVLFEENDPLIQRWSKEKFGMMARNINTKLIVNAFGQIIQAVSEGIGIAIVPEHVLNRSFYKDDVQILKGDYRIKNNTFNFMFHGELEDSKKLSCLYEYLKKGVKDFAP